MELICALDLLDGGAVRLEQGDYGRRVAAAPDPSVLAAGWVRDGARRIHVVDLEGARLGRPVHLDALADIAAAVGDAAPDAVVEVGGGLRRERDVARVLEAGAQQVVLGTAAIERPGFLAACARRWPGRVIASLDLRAGRVATDGWLQERDEPGVELAGRLLDEGAARLIITSADRDGTLGGPDLEVMAAYRHALPGAMLVAAGGVSGLADLRALAALGIDAAVVGLALLRGAFELRDALAVLAAEEARA
jgi:phosphoribosylformimino-5-aminoimidazole carboxamide ribotide isomerase